MVVKTRRIRLVGTYMNVGDDNAFNILVGENGGREPLGKT